MTEKDLKQLQVDYQTVFKSEAGERVLDDLKKRCSFCDAIRAFGVNS